ncbi:putative FAD-binding protein [Podosphaera aphanis]|nr:putative FAD-binding protein [Podosphaera aphanis]
MSDSMQIRSETVSQFSSEQSETTSSPIYTSTSDKPTDPTLLHLRRVSTKLISDDSIDVENLIGVSGTELIVKCCGGGCRKGVQKSNENSELERLSQPDNEAYRSLNLSIEYVPKNLTNVPELPSSTISISAIERDNLPSRTEECLAALKSPNHVEYVPTNTFLDINTQNHPPKFVQPHYPYDVYSAKILQARELTRPGAEKRTFHFELDVTDYPSETGVDFKVGGAIGICAPNDPVMVDDILNLLCIPRHIRDQRILLKTNSGRWPTVWGEDEARELITTRRDLLTWCSDVQSYPPTKNLLRILAEYAGSESEKKILLFLTSTEGQSAFCNLRTDSHITLSQLLNAFPSSKPPFEILLSHLQQLMPRFYSLSSDPQSTFSPEAASKRFIEIAVTIHKSPNWNSTERTGVGSGFLERQAKKFIQAEKKGIKPSLRVPIFKGLMTNPLAREFSSDGPMLLVGAGVGIAPFRGFVQRRLRNANCVNKVWVLQGIRDSLVDELYSGEWGVHESKVKKIVESRKSAGSCKYVQDEVRAQADLVWSIINSLDGRVFVCGSSKGMGQGVYETLVDVAMVKGNLDKAESESFWEAKKKAGQYIVETCYCWENWIINQLDEI